MKQYYQVFIALLFNTLDVVTGIIGAIKNREIKSTKLRDGLFNKVGFILCYVISYLVDRYGVLIGFDITIPILPCVILYVCTTELVSIIENLSKINSEIIPKKLYELFNLKGGENNV